MAIFTDGIHLVAHTLEELHEFANKVGLKKHFYHGYKKGHPHYDLTNDEIRHEVKKLGAIHISSKNIVRGFKDGTFNKKYVKP